MEYEAVIGLEVHAQLLTETKIFCGCSTKFGAEPNTNVCPVCLGMPGVLPVVNRKVVDFAIKLAIATNCSIASVSRFARKNYFYPDLPKGYQISQYKLPIAENGWIDVEVGGNVRRIRIRRIHMEEDAGKLIHDEHQPMSYVDFNRAGVPLLEIVSEPDIRTPEEAALYLKALRDIVVYLGICDGNMEEGSFRCDANVSLRPIGSRELGVKTELKNMNSFRNVQRALEFEIRRQRALLERGERITQETRLWDAAKGVTIGMRAKEEEHDYRYFPDPDLVPIVIDKAWIEKMRKTIPELPNEKRRRFAEEYGLPEKDIEILISDRSLADYFEETVRYFNNPKMVSNWILSELLRELNRSNCSPSNCPVSPQNLAQLLELIDNGTISGKIAKTVFEEMYSSGKKASDIVKERGLKQVADEGLLEQIIEEVIRSHPTEVERYCRGEVKLMGFFVGQIMKRTQGKANPKLVNEILSNKLKNSQQG
ncbi:MAG: Asp-tRNA(Asn)/Glu-tRNA(Gln) amidotransferase subunit GatB [Syntrophobacterales bacterium]|nr:Asp-tRNA(Asn)/Glu-tRNA(Gln) amidotransferase subunit GatB [Syntrophobacterales bacterium]